MPTCAYPLVMVIQGTGAIEASSKPYAFTGAELD